MQSFGAGVSPLHCGSTAGGCAELPLRVPIWRDLPLNRSPGSASSSPLAAHATWNHRQSAASFSFDELRLLLLILDLSLLV